MSDIKAMHAPPRPNGAETPVEGCWRAIGLVNHAAALGINVASIMWADGPEGVVVQLRSVADVDRLGDATGCDVTAWSHPDSGCRLYYRTAPGLRIYAGAEDEQ